MQNLSRTESLEVEVDSMLPEPVRPLKKGRSGVQISLFYSNKNQRLWNLESSIELDYAHFLEWSPDVLRFVPQPLEIEIVQQGQRKSYVPDFMHITTAMERVVTEIKPVRWDESPFMREKYDLVSRELNTVGVRFQVVTDRELRRNHLLANIRYLYPFYSQFSHSDLRAVVIALKKASGSATVKSLLNSDPPLSFATLAGYAYENWVGIENSIFDYNTMLSAEV